MAPIHTDYFSDRLQGAQLAGQGAQLARDAKCSSEELKQDAAIAKCKLKKANCRRKPSADAGHAVLTLVIRLRWRGDVRKPLSSRMLRPANRFVLTLLTLLFLSSREGGLGAVGRGQKAVTKN
jgi:hypothetical protein